MSSPLDPTDAAQMSAGTRGSAQTHGAATDPGAIRAFVLATGTRRAASRTTAVVVTREPRGYTTADHERAEALRGEAQAVRRIAAAKPSGFLRRIVEREAESLEADAEAIVPLEHARAGWR